MPRIQHIIQIFRDLSWLVKNKSSGMKGISQLFFRKYDAYPNLVAGCVQQSVLIGRGQKF